MKNTTSEESILQTEKGTLQKREMYEKYPEDRAMTNESGSQHDTSICEQSQVKGGSYVSFPFIKEENTDSNNEKKRKKHKKRKKGVKGEDDVGVRVYEVEREQICQSPMMTGYNQHLGYYQNNLEEDEMIPQKKKKKKKKHKHACQNLGTSEDVSHFDLDIKKDPLSEDEAANHAKKKKKKKKKKITADDETRNNILRNHVENTRQYSIETISGMTEMKHKVKHKKAHKENSSKEKTKIWHGNVKESRMNEIGLNEECEENQHNFDPESHEKKNLNEKMRNKEKRTKKEKRKKEKRKKEVNTMPQRSENMRIYDPQEDNSEESRLSLLQNAKINLVDVDVKKRKSKETASYKRGDVPSQVIKKEIVTRDEFTAMHANAKKDDASNIQRKRMHQQSDESISLEFKVLLENVKKKRLDDNNMELVGMQNLEDSINNGRKRKKNKKHHNKKLIETQEPSSRIENIDNCATVVKAQNKLSSVYSSHEIDSKTNEMKPQRERSNIVEESTEDMTNIYDSISPDIQNSIIELKGQKSNEGSGSMDVLTNAQDVEGNFKDNELLKNKDKEMFEENCNTSQSYNNINSNVVPQTRRKRKVDDNNIEYEGRKKSLRKLNSQRNSNDRLGIMSGNKLGENDWHRKTSKETVASNTTFNDTGLLNTSRNLAYRIPDLKVHEYHLKWHLSAEDKEELKKKGIEFEKGRWRAEEVKKLEDNFQSILTQTRMTSHDLVKLIEDKSSEAKRRRTDLGIYHFLLEGINRPIKLVHQKLKKLCDPNHFKGKWLKTEEEMLLKLYKKHGHDWTKIGELMGRSKDSVIHKIQRILCGPVTKNASRVKNTSRWTEDETKRLSKAVEKITNNGTHSNGKKFDSREIDWSTVSGAVKTRSAESCRFKWVFDLSIREPGAGKKNWTTEQNMMFLEMLSKCGKSHEKDVDWAQILKDLNLPGNVPILKRKWKFYRLLVPYNEKLNFEQQLDWLTRIFMKRVRERRQYTEVKSEEQGD